VPCSFALLSKTPFCPAHLRISLDPYGGTVQVCDLTLSHEHVPEPLYQKCFRIEPIEVSAPAVATVDPLCSDSSIAHSDKAIYTNVTPGILLHLHRDGGPSPESPTSPESAPSFLNSDCRRPLAPCSIAFQ
jgi:hypothetical protein